MSDSAAAVAADLRSTVYNTAVAAGGVAEYEHVLKMYTASEQVSVTSSERSSRSCDVIQTFQYARSCDVMYTASEQVCLVTLIRF
jgi:hypothetical protein